MYSIVNIKSNRNVNSFTINSSNFNISNVAFYKFYWSNLECCIIVMLNTCTDSCRQPSMKEFMPEVPEPIQSKPRKTRSDGFGNFLSTSQTLQLIAERANRRWYSQFVVYPLSKCVLTLVGLGQSKLLQELWHKRYQRPKLKMFWNHVSRVHRVRKKMFTQENPALPAWSPSELYSPRPTLNVSLILTIYVLHGIRYSVNIFTRPAGSYLRVLNLDLNSDCSQ